jgi:hypothetical protein
MVDHIVGFYVKLLRAISDHSGGKAERIEKIGFYAKTSMDSKGL